MAAIEDRVLHDERNADTIRQMRSTTDPVLLLQSISRLVRNIYEGNAPTYTAVYGACVVSPQLAELENEFTELRLRKQAPFVADLCATGKLLPELDEMAVRDILWAFTSREIYYLFVVRRGWSPDRYEQQLASMLVTALVRRDAIAPEKACKR